MRWRLWILDTSKSHRHPRIVAIRHRGDLRTCEPADFECFFRRAHGRLSDFDRLGEEQDVAILPAFVRVVDLTIAVGAEHAEQSLDADLQSCFFQTLAD